MVVLVNEALCHAKSATHKPTSEGYEPARLLWENSRSVELWLDEVTEICQKCHKLAPFCNFNGNTFVTVVRQLIEALQIPPDQKQVLRSLAGHLVAGTSGPTDAAQFRNWARRS